MIGNASQLKKEYEKNCREQRIKNLKHLRENIAKISASDFCKELGIPKSNFSDIENGKEGRNLSLYNIQAYKTYFKEKHSLDISTDFLLGYTDILTTDSNIQMIHKETGLSEASICKITKFSDEQKKVLDMIIKHNRFMEFILRTQNYLHSANTPITIINEITSEEADEDEFYKTDPFLQPSSKDVHQYIITESLKRILDDIYAPYIQIALELITNSFIQRIFFYAFQSNDKAYVDSLEGIKADAKICYDYLENANPKHDLFYYKLEYILSNPADVWKKVLKTDPPEDYNILLKTINECNYTL